MDRRSPALHGDRCRHRRTARHVLPRHVSARRKIQSLRRIWNYQRPVATLLCNFPPPSGDKPSLMTHSDVETLFHEFGHCLHEITTRAKHGRFAGTHVPGDFVEAPSQMLQNWVWSKKVLDTFAADYRDPSKKIPSETIQKMNDAKKATAGIFYRRQFAFASLDLAIHDAHPEDAQQ